MGDYYQTAADLDADLQTAKEVAARLRDWMISKEIIVAATSDCVLSRGGGHAPGKNYTLAAEKPASSLFETRPNGVSFIAERTVFYSAGNEIALVCAACGKGFGSNDSWDAAVGNWFKEHGSGLLACPHCGVEAPITEWPHDPPWAFGNVGLEFWNWPPLKPEFLKALGDLTGHRFRLVWGKI